MGFTLVVMETSRDTCVQEIPQWLSSHPWGYPCKGCVLLDLVALLNPATFGNSVVDCAPWNNEPWDFSEGAIISWLVLNLSFCDVESQRRIVVAAIY